MSPGGCRYKISVDPVSSSSARDEARRPKPRRAAKAEQRPAAHATIVAVRARHRSVIFASRSVIAPLGRNRRRASQTTPAIPRLYCTLPIVASLLERRLTGRYFVRNRRAPPRTSPSLAGTLRLSTLFSKRLGLANDPSFAQTVQSRQAVALACLRSPTWSRGNLARERPQFLLRISACNA